jgi:hypothetical protein
MSCTNCTCNKTEGCTCFGNGIVIPNGPDGENGLSAYEIWLALGNTGTQQDFIDSLTGPAGAAGAQGEPGAPGVCPCETVHYEQFRSHIIGEGSVVTTTSDTIPDDGLYEIMHVGIADFIGAATVDLIVRVNGLQYNADVDKKISGQADDIIPYTVFVSQMNLTAGQTIDVFVTATAPASVSLGRLVTKISKVG